MPRGSKSKYSLKQIRKAHHIEQGYERRGLPKTEAERRAWATVNKMHGGGSKGGSGSEQIIDLSPSKKGGKNGGKRQAQRLAVKRSVSAKKAVRTKKKHKKQSKVLWSGVNVR